MMVYGHGGPRKGWALRDLVQVVLLLAFAGLCVHAYLGSERRAAEQRRVLANGVATEGIVTRKFVTGTEDLDYHLDVVFLTDGGPGPPTGLPGGAAGDWGGRTPPPMRFPAASRGAGPDPLSLPGMGGMPGVTIENGRITIHPTTTVSRVVPHSLYEQVRVSDPLAVRYLAGDPSSAVIADAVGRPWIYGRLLAMLFPLLIVGIAGARLYKVLTSG